MRRLLVRLDIDQLVREQRAREAATVEGVGFMRGLMSAVALVAVCAGAFLLVLGLAAGAVHGWSPWALFAIAGAVLAGTGALLLNIIGRGR